MKSLATALIIVALLAACGEERVIGSEDDPFGSATWQLASATVDGAPLDLVDGSPVTLLVDDGQVGGRAACNSYGGDIAISAGVVTIGPSIDQTEMACLEDGVMELEAAYLTALPRATTVSRDGDALVLGGDGVEMRFVPQPEPEPAALIGTTWSLDTIVDGETASTPAATGTLLIGADGSVSGTPGCNQMSGTYDGDGGFGPLATTRMACGGTVMDQEALVLEVLSDNPTLAIEGDRLTISDLHGRALVYRAG